MNKECKDIKLKREIISKTIAKTSIENIEIKENKYNKEKIEFWLTTYRDIILTKLLSQKPKKIETNKKILKNHPYYSLMNSGNFSKIISLKDPSKNNLWVLKIEIKNISAQISYLKNNKFILQKRENYDDPCSSPL